MNARTNGSVDMDNETLIIRNTQTVWSIWTLTADITYN